LIRELKQQPEIFKHINAPCYYFQVEKDNRIFCWIAVHDEGPVAGVHVEVESWTNVVRKQLESDWESLKDILRSKGITALYATNSEHENKQWIRFINLFGFGDPIVISISYQEI